MAMFVVDDGSKLTFAYHRPLMAELRLQGPLCNMRSVCRRRLDRNRPGFGEPCNLCFGPFGSLCRVGFLEAQSNATGHVHTMRAGLSCSQLLRCYKLIELSTDALGFSRRIAVLLIEQCDILFGKVRRIYVQLRRIARGTFVLCGIDERQSRVS